MKQLINLLQDIGHSPKEAQVLDVLLRSEPLRAQEIADRTDINRTTVYSVLKELQASGLVHAVEEYGVAKFGSIAPDQLPSYLARKRSLLETYETQIETLVPQLMDAQSGRHAFPKVSFFQGVEGVKQAYEDTLEHNKEGAIYVFSGPDIVFEQLGKEYVAYYTNKRTKLGIKSYQVAPDTTWGRFIKEKDAMFIRNTMIIPAEFSFDTEMVMYDNKLGIFSFSEETLIAVIIEDMPVVNTMKALFRYIRDVGEMSI
jgi:sugar-specific transcriptional regulator TrmB